MHRDLQRQLDEVSRVRAATSTHIRRAFAQYGFNVGHCRDEQLSRAVLDVASRGTRSSADLFTQAFARLRADQASFDPWAVMATAAARTAVSAMAGRM